MIKNSHKIKAFTLSEMIVVVLLTVIVAGLAFSVLQLVQKHMYAIKSNFENSTSITLLEQSLWIDANRSNTMRYDTAEDKLYFISEIDTITYTFTPVYIQKDLDTFNIAVAEKLFYFEGKETFSSTIDAFKLITAKEFRKRAVFISKRNTANTYMNP